MKPVVTSIVALAIAVAPFAAFAADKPVHKKPAKVVAVAHKAPDKSEKSEKPVAEKSEKAEKAGLVKVKLTDKTPPHKEPKIEKPAKSSMLSTVSMKSKEPSGKDMPKEKGSKSMKIGAEKSAPRKASEKKSADGGKDDGEISRDEELAGLVARIRGNDEQAKESNEGKEPKAKHGPKETKEPVSKAPCTKLPVEMIRGAEVEHFDFATCTGSVAPLVVEQLSVLIRPGSAARPVAPLAELAKSKGPDIAKGVRRVDARLAERIKEIVTHFEKPGTTAKIDIVSGYRPQSIGSMHASGRAMDFRIEGVKNEELVSFCKTLEDTGCGYYPNSSFVHVDVRDEGAGHVSWIDASGPGETPRYLPTWPPPPLPAAIKEELEKASAGEPVASELPPLPTFDKESVTDPVDNHPAEVPTKQ